MCNWCREAGRRNGFVVVIKSSDAGTISKKPRITLGCERGGTYRTKKEKRIKTACGTKKCGCPFALRGKKLDTADDWILLVVCGVHNHPAAENLEGHSYAGRLSEQETELLVDMSKSLVRPKDILSTLKERDALNVTTIKTIYNVRQRFKVAEKAGRSEMQHLLGKLSEAKYIEWHRNCTNTDVVHDLFWAHPGSIDLFRAFPRVLIMDCTYKTNRYRLPLLEIVGVTSTDMTFSVAFVYLNSEGEESYTWALERLRSVIADDVLPELIVTDRDLALMNAIHRVFPTARHLLCRWHISRNVLAKCKKFFELKEKWDKFIMSWNVLVLSSTEDEYNDRWSALQREFGTYPDALQYVSDTWLSKYKERFVAAWTDTCRHYGNVTTNRYHK